MRCLFVFIFAMGCLAGPASPQSLVRASGPFNETLRDSAQISGAVIAGAQVRAKTEASWGIDPKLPETVKAGDTLCLRIVSANGLYDAENEYTVSDDAPPSGPLIDLRKETEHDAFLADLEGKAIAAVASLGTCDDTPTRLLLVSWGTGQATEVTLFVNSFRADTVVAKVEETGDIRRCSPIVLEVRSAYDTECRIDLSGVGNDVGEVTVELARFVNRQTGRSTEINLVLPDR